MLLCNQRFMRQPTAANSFVCCQMVHVAGNSVKIGGARIFSCIVMSEFLTALAGLRTSNWVTSATAAPYVRMPKEAYSFSLQQQLTACSPSHNQS